MESAFQRFPFVLLCSLASLIPCSNAQQVSSNTVAPQELVRRAVANELNPPDGNKKYLFQHYKKSPNGTQTMIYAQTRDAIAGMVIAVNDKPLTPDQRKGESQRVQRFIDDPDELKKKQKQEKENLDRVTRIIRALPDAFLYQDDGAEPGRTGVGKTGEELRRLSFQPNPKYDPPTRIEQILTGMQGHILIDPTCNRIAMIDGTLQKDVSFGWGILGHLDRGGHIKISQGDVGDKHWQMTSVDMAFTGKILLFKSINAQSTETYSDFHPVASDTTFSQGVDLLKKYEAQWLLSQNLTK
ncbi:MAG TPA: hypothetical protein VIW67_02980 [Terriglobales bacterium]|jgi:hypothetical protein